MVNCFYVEQPGEKRLVHLELDYPKNSKHLKSNNFSISIFE